MKFWFSTLALLSLSLSSTAFADSRLDPDKPEDALKLFRKVVCGYLEDNKTQNSFVEGKVYSNLAWEKNKHIFNVWVMNSRQCSTHIDAKRGKGFRMVSREVMLYLDPETNEVLKTWENPWTGETVDVLQVKNDPVNMRTPTFEYDKDGKPLTIELTDLGFATGYSLEVPLFYPNTLRGDYQEYVGGEYQATEMFNYFFETDEFLDPKALETTSSRIHWSRVSQWLPFMKMGSRPGGLIINGVGGSVDSIEDYPPEFLKELKTNYPKFLTPPPADDQRANETSWVTFKAQIDQERAAAKK